MTDKFRIEPTFTGNPESISQAESSVRVVGRNEVLVQQQVPTASRIGTDTMMLIEMRVSNARKSTALGYVLWFFLGTFGVHNFYLRRPILGMLELLCGIFYWVFWIPSVLLMGLVGSAVDDAAFWAGGWGIVMLPVALLGLLLIFDLFTIPSAVTRVSDRLREKLLNDALKGLMPTSMQVTPQHR